jgi:protein-disulfide isomerase
VAISLLRFDTMLRHGPLDPPVRSDDHALGPGGAAVVLVEYGDYECPQCARAHGVLGRLLAELGDRVRYVFRNFPLTDIHPHAQVAAEAAESVARHAGADAFWDMHDMLFMNQDALEIDDLLGYAEAAGADADAVAGDLAAGATRRRVLDDFDSGIRSGVAGTPTFFVNGTYYDGSWEEAASFAAALREAATARQD